MNYIIDTPEQIVTALGTLPMRGEHQDRLQVITGKSVFVADGKIAGVDTTAHLLKRFSKARNARRIPGKGRIVLPGFIDPHTHLPFSGNRREEFNLRLRGSTYMEIARRGGGILATLKAVREATPHQLYRDTLVRARTCMAYGVTTVEAKSGYGLNLKDEIKQLEVLQKVAKEVPLRIMPTLLAAHEFPTEFKQNKDAYVDLICGQIIPEVAGRKLAVFCDVFCEKGVFSPGQTLKILRTGQRYGLKSRLHADEFVQSGAAVVAGQVHALSADHLNFPSEEGLMSMARAGTVAVLLPGASMFLLHRQHVNVPDLRRYGIPIAMATDCNPGSSPTTNLLMVMRLGCFTYGMTSEAAINAVTINAAVSLDLAKETGTVEQGKCADLSVWDVPHYLDLFYHYGDTPLACVMCRGTLVFPKKA
jgi:imidazolonepropionase